MILRAERGKPWIVGIVGTVAALMSLALGEAASRGEEFYFASSHATPGAIWHSEHQLPERQLHQRPTEPLVSAPGSVPRIANLAISAEGKQYYCSGLDGYILHNLRGHDVVTCSFAGQIRDLAFGRENHTLYFSVVATPQDGEALADGAIYKYDWYTGGPVEIVRVKQQPLGGQWWGTFAIHDGAFYLATLEDSSKIFRLDGEEPLPVFNDTGVRITGFTMGSDGEYFFATGGLQAFRTRDFRRPQPAFTTRRRITDVAVPSAAKSE